MLNLGQLSQSLTSKVMSEQRFEAVRITHVDIWRNIPHRGNSTEKDPRHKHACFYSGQKSSQMTGVDQLGRVVDKVIEGLEGWIMYSLVSDHKDFAFQSQGILPLEVLCREVICYAFQQSHSDLSIFLKGSFCCGISLQEWRDFQSQPRWSKQAALSLSTINYN